MPFTSALMLYPYLGYLPQHAWPTNLPRLLSKGLVQQRRVGATAFADSSRYRPYVLSAEEREHYFRLGWVHLKRVLPPELLQELREHLMQSGVPLWPWSINGFMDDDALQDFYLFGPLGHIASQVFGGGPATLFSDFRYWRERGQELSNWHYDGGECEHPLLLANETARARVRFWVTLDHDALGPVLGSQTLYNDILPGEMVKKYWAGKLAGPASEATSDLKLLSDLQPSHRNHFVQPNVSLGDVIVHSPCLIHKSPIAADRRLVGFLCPTYQPQQSKYFVNSESSPDRAARNCKHSLREGDTIGVEHPCYPQAYPPPDHIRGREVEFRYAGSQVGDATRWHWWNGFVGRRVQDAKTWYGWANFTSGSILASERPLAQLVCRAGARLSELGSLTPGVDYYH